MSCGAEREAEPERTAQARRVVSLAPHLTELAFAAGAGPNLVGVSEYSDFPPEARSLPRIGDAFSVDFERMAELAPDLVLAWKGGTPVTVIERLRDLGLSVLELETAGLEDIPQRLGEIGRVAGDPALAGIRAEEFRNALGALRQQTPVGAARRVFYQISLHPLFTVGAGHYIGEVLELCGGENIFSDLAELAPAVSHEAVLERRPDLILTDRRGLEESRLFWRRFHENIPVRGVDADLVARPGLRLAEGAQQVCDAIAADR